MMNEPGSSDGEWLDYFSFLPESIIHHILSFLPFMHIVSSCILSKRWNRIWLNYPNIEVFFNEQSYLKECHLVPFLEHVEGIMYQCLFRKVCIQKMKLAINVLNLKELAPNIDRWLVDAIKRNVSELSINIFYVNQAVDFPNYFYQLPKEIVVADSLKVLDLGGCLFEDRFNRISLPHLREFKLLRCQFGSENLLNKILCGCPELESLCVSVCKGVGSFLLVSCKPRLNYFSVCCDEVIAKIEICAPSLEHFKCTSVYPCAIELASCTALKRVELDGAFLSADYVPIQDILSKLLCIEELELLNCRAVDKIRISSSCLKKLVMSYCFLFPGAEFDMPNLHGLEFIALDGCESDNHFSSWIVPKVEQIHMAFSVRSFITVCRAGLKGFLMKLHTYDQFKLLIKCKGEQNFIMHEKLHAVSFSSLSKFIKKAKPQCIVISSQRYKTLLKNTLIYGSGNVRLSLIFSSRENIELLYKKLSVSLLRCFSTFELVSTEDIEHEMDSPWKSFMKTHSNGYHTATIILHRRSWKDIIWRSMSGCTRKPSWLE